jgi:signal peptidase I
MNKRWKEGLYGMLDALGIFALVVLIIIAYGCTNNRWYRMLVVRSGSMAPVLNAGDLILISRPPEEILDPGTIITFRVGDKIVTHRIVQVTPEGYITQGDANSVTDGWVVAPQNGLGSTYIVGVYRGRIPHLGYVAGWLFHLPESMDDWMSTRVEFGNSKTFTIPLRSGTWTTPEPPIDSEVPPEPILAD